ncbi:MAG TPA: replicative DNA helicase [Bacteroidota bacterium]|nr:replicative DNA helicase [Bacteroidota bacterium]
MANRKRGPSGPDSSTIPASEGRVPPQAVDVEKAVLGAMLIDREAVPKALESLNEDSFYTPMHRKIFRAMNGLFERSEPVDAVTVTEELRKQGTLDPSNDPLYVTELTMNVSTAANIEYHARIILEKSLMRSLIASATEVASRAYNETEDALDLLDEAEGKIFSISEQRLKKSFTPLHSALAETMETLQALHGMHGGITGVPSGFPKLDDKTGGFQKSDLIIIAGRPSQGKTALALSMARNAALHKDKKTAVGIFSLEMAEQQLIIRLLAAEAKVNAHELRTGRLHEDKWKNLSRNVGRLAEAKIFIDDTPALSILELRAKARRLKAEHGIGLVIADYLQLIQGPKNAESREREISMISRSLKALAKELNIPVIALSQLNRAVEARGDKRPMLADLRECVTGDTLVCLADGRRVPISQLVGREIPVLTMYPDERIGTALSDAVWRVGRRPVFEVRLSSGRSIRATAEHRLYGFDGWRKVNDLTVGESLAVASRVHELVGSHPDADTTDIEDTGWERTWDEIISIHHYREEDVFDLTVPETSSWLADGLVSHNSGAIEQDADVVMFVHRPEMYGIMEIKDEEYGTIPSEGVAEIIIGKQRNGPTAVVRLAFHKEYAGFERLAPMGMESMLPPPVSVGEDTPF